MACVVACMGRRMQVTKRRSPKTNQLDAVYLARATTYPYDHSTDAERCGSETRKTHLYENKG